jgi:hypothetical protein
MLDVHAAARAGVPLERLLWIRCNIPQALPAAEIVLKAGGFGLVAIDLGSGKEKRAFQVPTAAWLRLQRGAEQQGTAVLVVSPRSMTGAWSACTLALGPGRPLFAPTRRVLLALETPATLTRGGQKYSDGLRESSRAHALEAPIVLHRQGG